MRTIISQRNRISRKKSLKRISIFLAGLIVLILLESAFGIFRTIFLTVSTPAFKIKTAIEERQEGGLFSSKESLLERIDELEGQVDDLQSQVQSTDLLKQENESLKDALSYVQEELPGYFAKVINRPPHIPYDTLFIDQGCRDGITDGNVVTVKGVAVGFIEKCYIRHSIVRLFSSPDNRTIGVLNGKSIDVTGLGDGRYSVRLPQNVPLEQHDPIYDQSQRYVLGYVDTFSDSDAAAFVDVYSSLPVSLRGITDVVIYNQSI